MKRVEFLSKQLFRNGYVPIAPHIYFPAFSSEDEQRDQVLDSCLELVRRCDRVLVFAGRGITDGMRGEMAEAIAHSIPITMCNEPW